MRQQCPAVAPSILVHRLMLVAAPLKLSNFGTTHNIRRQSLRHRKQSGRDPRLYIRICLELLKGLQQGPAKNKSIKTSWVDRRHQLSGSGAETAVQTGTSKRLPRCTGELRETHRETRVGESRQQKKLVAVEQVGPGKLTYPQKSKCPARSKRRISADSQTELLLAKHPVVAFQPSRVRRVVLGRRRQSDIASVRV